MIEIGGIPAPSSLPMLTDLEQYIYTLKMESPTRFSYASAEELRFELRLRSHIVGASRALAASGAQFATFAESRCNPLYWTLTPAGGFVLNPGVQPADGISDIYRNGWLYAFECATAMVIVLYAAVLETIGEQRFNELFAGIVLYDWHYDSDLRLITVDGAKESFPGDILYIKNPDFSPANPEWQGENIVELGGGLYFGHGIGVTTVDRIIHDLNMRRRPGSVVSAYLTDLVTYPDFRYLYYAAAGFRSEASYSPVFAGGSIQVRIGAARTIFV